MNAELVSSGVDSEASWSRPPLSEATGGLLGGWWECTLGRLDAGECARTPDTVARAFEATPDSVRAARELAAGAVEEWGLAEVGDDLRLIVSELVGNACRHAVPEGRSPEETRVLLQLRHLSARRQVVCMVADQVERGPVKVEAHHFAESGRGLGLVAAFSRTWGWDPVRGEGKIVWAVCGGED
ncbi:ATP-binding protein [Nocardiopsis sp. NPDC050513]|uniref:ATP-binding protein n=1 Tax=Nocardiopsis sp. NPDC050513 TaxID=3364338 RepID=UPI0037A9E956